MSSLPNVSYFRVFGSKCYALQKRSNSSKFAPKVYEGFLLSYDSNSRAYLKAAMTICLSPHCPFCLHSRHRRRLTLFSSTACHCYLVSPHPLLHTQVAEHRLASELLSEPLDLAPCYRSHRTSVPRPHRDPLLVSYRAGISSSSFGVVEGSCCHPYQVGESPLMLPRGGRVNRRF
jgi:hypothetical protein